MNKEEIIEYIWSEYHAHEPKLSDPVSASFLQYSGHAQCALSILARLGEDCREQHMHMARVMAKVIGVSLP